MHESFPFTAAAGLVLRTELDVRDGEDDHSYQRSQRTDGQSMFIRQKRASLETLKFDYALSFLPVFFHWRKNLQNLLSASPESLSESTGQTKASYSFPLAFSFLEMDADIQKWLYERGSLSVFHLYLFYGRGNPFLENALNLQIIWNVKWN